MPSRVMMEKLVASTAESLCRSLRLKYAQARPRSARLQSRTWNRASLSSDSCQARATRGTGWRVHGRAGDGGIVRTHPRAHGQPRTEFRPERRSPCLAAADLALTPGRKPGLGGPRLPCRSSVSSAAVNLGTLSEHAILLSNLPLAAVKRFAHRKPGTEFRDRICRSPLSSARPAHNLGPNFSIRGILRTRRWPGRDTRMCSVRVRPCALRHPR